MSYCEAKVGSVFPADWRLPRTGGSLRARAGNLLGWSLNVNGILRIAQHSDSPQG